MLEEKIKRIKVTRDSLTCFANFDREPLGDEIKDLKLVTEEIKIKHLFKTETVKRTGLEYTNSDGICETAFMVAAETVHRNVYDVYVCGNGRGKFEYLTPIQISSDGRIYSVSKITFHNIEAGKEVVRRLYFPVEDKWMYDDNLEEFAALRDGTKDTIWIMYGV